MKRIIVAAGLLMLFTSANAQAPDPNLNRNKRWTLEELVAYAQQNNLQVRQSELDLLSSSIEKQRSKLDLLPSLNGNANYSYRTGRSIDPATNVFVTQSFNAQQYSLSSDVTLFNGFALRNTIKQNTINEEARELDLADARNDIGLNVATAYLNILLNQELLKNSESRLIASNTQLDRTQSLVDAGSQAKASFYEVNAQVANDKLAVTNAQNNLELARLNLIQLLQLSADEAILVEVPDFTLDEVTPYPLAASSVYGQAVTNQPDIKAAELRVESSEMGVAIAKGNLYPVVSISGSIGTNYSSGFPTSILSPNANPDIEPSSTPNGVVLDAGGNIIGTSYGYKVVFKEDDYINYTYTDQLKDNLSKAISLNLRIPIFNGYRAGSNVAQARITADRSRLQQKLVEQQLRQNIEQAALDVQAAALSYRASQEQVNSLREAFRATEQRFNIGASTALDFSVAKANLDAAEANFIRSKYDYIFKTKVLDFYVGKPLSFQ